MAGAPTDTKTWLFHYKHIPDLLEVLSRTQDERDLWINQREMALVSVEVPIETSIDRRLMISFPKGLKLEAIKYLRKVIEEVKKLARRRGQPQDFELKPSHGLEYGYCLRCFKYFGPSGYKGMDLCEFGDEKTCPTCSFCKVSGCIGKDETSCPSFTGVVKKFYDNGEKFGSIH